MTLQKKLIITACVVGACVALFSYFEYPTRGVRAGVLYVATPFWKGEQYIGARLSDWGVALRSKRDLAEENRELREKIVALGFQSLENSLLSEENEKLKERLGRRDQKRTTIAGVVLSRPNQTPYDTFILDIGARDGVSVEDRVVAYENIMIGTVSEVFSDTSVVKLFSSPGEVLQVTLGEEQVMTTARGIGGGNFEATIPRGIPIHEGDTVSFPAISLEIIGVVEKVNARPADAFQTVLFKMPVNLFELRIVEVLK